jgi:hypothetical protein
LRWLAAWGILAVIGVAWSWPIFSLACADCVGGHETADGYFFGYGKEVISWEPTWLLASGSALVVTLVAALMVTAVRRLVR